jgi:hypothetical protein
MALNMKANFKEKNVIKIQKNDFEQGISISYLSD